TGALAGCESETDCQQTIAPQRIVCDSILCRSTAWCEQDIGVVTLRLEPKQFLKRSLDLCGKVMPFVAVRGLSTISQLTQETYPKRLDFYRIAFSLGAGWKIGVHPRKVAGAPDEAGSRVHLDAVGSAFDIVQGDTFEHLANSPIRCGV